MPGEPRRTQVAVASTHALVAARRARVPARLHAAPLHGLAPAPARRPDPARRAPLRALGAGAPGAARRVAARDLPWLLRAVAHCGGGHPGRPRGGGRGRPVRRGGVGARGPPGGMAAGAHLILGAGLGGLALADALLDEDVAGPVVLLDRRTTWPRDRTWCFWDVDVPYAGLATHRWAEWEVVTSAGTAVRRSDRHAYLRLPADRFYADVLERLGRDPRAEVRTGVAGAPKAEAQAPVPGAVVPAARGPMPPPRGGLAQRFLGLEVETDEPRFTPGRATLMDFRVSQDGGL